MELAKDSISSNSIIKLGHTVELMNQLGQNALQGDLCKHHRLNAGNNRCMSYVTGIYTGETKEYIQEKTIQVDINYSKIIFS